MDGLDLLDLKILPVIQRIEVTRHARRCNDGRYELPQREEVDDCEVLRYAVQPPSSWTAPWSRPADCARGEVRPYAVSASLSGGIRCR